MARGGQRGYGNAGRSAYAGGNKGGQSRAVFSASGANDPIIAPGNQHLFGVRSRTVADNVQFEQWLGAPADLVLQFVEGNGATTTWAQNIAITDKVCTDWAGIDRRYEWGFPLCSTGEPMADTASGKYDAEIEAMFRRIASFDRHKVVPIRLGWEANNPTAYPWSWTANGSSAALYIEAFRRVVTIGRRVSPRFKFVWCVLFATFGTDGQVVNPEPGYPGDDYVDIIGMDAYYDGVAELGSGTNIQRFVGKLFAQYGLGWVAAFSLGRGKPVTINEWGINNDSPDYVNAKSRWLRQLPNLFYACYFNVDAGSVQFRNKISTDQYPQASIAFKNQNGPLSISTPAAFNAPTGSAFSAKLEGNKHLTWSIIGAAGPFSIVASGMTARLTAAAQAPSVQSVRVRATDERGQIVEKTLTVTFVAGATEPETQFYIARASAAPSAAFVNAVNALVAGIKANDLWDMFDRFYLLQNVDQQLAACDLMSIQAAGAFAGTVTFTPKLGVRSDGSTGYFDTRFQPSMPANRGSQDDHHFAIWSLTNIERAGGGDAHEFGAGTTVRLSRLVNGNASGLPVQNAAVTLAGGPFPGHVMAVRSGAAAWRTYRRGAPALSGTDASARLPYETYKALGSRVADGQFGGNDIAIVHFGRGIGWTDAKVLALHGLLDTFRNTVPNL